MITNWSTSRLNCRKRPLLHRHRLFHRRPHSLHAKSAQPTQRVFCSLSDTTIEWREVDGRPFFSSLFLFRRQGFSSCLQGPLWG